MKGLFGVMALLIVLAMTAMLMGRQIRSAGPPVVSSEAMSASGSPAVGSASAPALGDLQRTRDDVTRAMEQAAAARKDAQDK